MTARTYHIWTNGCQMNEADSRRLAQQLEFAGWTPAPHDDAGLLVLNTCVVRQQAEDKAVAKLYAARAAKEQRPGTLVALMGCMVGMREAPELARKFPFVDVFLSPSETSPLLDHLHRIGRLDDDTRRDEARNRAIVDAIQDGDLPLPEDQRDAVTAHVPIVLGCSHACTFCVIPYRRGAERSRPMADILAEIRSLARQGVREVMLLGQIVDRYGVDFDDGTDLSVLLREVARIDDLHRIRFLTSHPNYMTDRILETVAAEPKICPQIEVPIQAGNDIVLENMRRGYTVQQYRDLVARIRRIIPGATIHTDIIVGFPGETHDQFLDTLRLVEELRIDKIHLSKYSVRPKTIAARKLPDDVPEDEKQSRWQQIEDLQAAILDEKNRELRGVTVEVLVEGLQKGRWRGRTRHGKLVFFEDLRDLRGRLVDVTIDWTGPFSMIGRAADPASRKPLPVLVE